MSQQDSHFLALSGGVGGAKMALGLSRCLSAKQLTIIANTADDFEHLGLHISPDLDSVMYALGSVDDPDRGWGLADESWEFMNAVETLGGDTWFRLGDKDMATHVLRSQALRDGENLGEATSRLCHQFGITHTLLPMSNDPVRTQVFTAEGILPFQHYFVRRQCEPVVTGFAFDGIDSARPDHQFMQVLVDPALSGIIICPSNPYVSIDPIIDLPGVYSAIKDSSAPVIAVSPIVAGQALKGPAAKMMQELGKSVNVVSIAEHYAELLNYFVIDHSDEQYRQQIEELGVTVVAAEIVMRTIDDKVSLARLLINTLEQG